MKPAIPTSTTSPRRRALLGQAGALTVAAIGAAGLLYTKGDAATLPADHPDAALIRICAEHIVNYHAYNDHGGPMEPEDDPLWLAYDRTLEAIIAAKPQTLAGMVAKAQVAKVEATDPEGDEAEKVISGMDDWFAWDLVNDLLRLHGGVA